MEDLLLDAADALKREGVRIDHEARPDFTFEYAVGVYDQLLGGALSGGFSREKIEEFAAEATAADDAHALRARHASQRHRDWLSAHERRLQMRRKWRTFFDEPAHQQATDHSRRRAPTLQRPASLDGPAGVTYLPATVVPVGLTDDGLPVGAQLVGPFLEDRTVLALGRHLEAIHGGFVRPEGY